MGLLDFFRKKEKERLDDPLNTSSRFKYPSMDIKDNLSQSPTEIRSQIDLLTSQMQSLRLQYDAINARLQNIERIVTEIRSYC